MTTKTIVFRADRRAMPSKLHIGYETDNSVVEVVFILPMLDKQQTATLMLGGKYVDMVLLGGGNTQYSVVLTADIIGAPGSAECYVCINTPDGRVWNSAPFTLVTGDLPDIDTEVEKRYPGAVEQLRQEIAEHNSEMAETVAKAEDAAKRAEDAAASISPDGNMPIGGYYVPSVSDDGELSWTPSADGMPKVPEANIKGAPGESITIDEIIGSSDDSEQTIVFSDGTSLTIPSGKDGADGFTFVPDVEQLGPDSAEINFTPTRSPSLNPQSYILSLPKGDKGDPGKYYTVDLEYLGDGVIRYTRTSSDPDEETIIGDFDLKDYYDAPSGDDNEGNLPAVTDADNGKVLTVVDGKWAAAELPKYDGAYVVVPGVEAQELLTAQTFMDANLKIEAIPYAEVTNAANGVTATIG